jgi:hypothetical protein
MTKGGLALGLIGGVIGAMVAIPFSFIPMGPLAWWARLVIVVVIGAIPGSLIGVMIGVPLAAKGPPTDWCRCRWPGHPQPVPPIYGPEVAARAIASLARSRRRQRIVGAWNWLVVHGNKVIPGVLDHYAGRSSWSGQQMAQDRTGQREGSLDRPLDDEPSTDRGAHGRFGNRARGALDPRFLRSLGQAGRDLAASVRDRAREWLSAVAD